MKKPVQKRKGGGKILGGMVGGLAGALMEGDIRGAIPGLAGVAVNQAKKRRARGTDGPSGPSAPTGVTRMKEGGKVGRGDGKCIKGRTKGRMV